MKAGQLAACVMILIAAACNGGPKDNYKPAPAASIVPASVAKGQEHTLMPLKVGNQWTYSMETVRAVRGQTQPVASPDMTWKVVSVTPVANGGRATIEVSQDGRPVDRQIWQVDDKGIFQLSVGLTPQSFSSPKPVVSFPIQEGNTFQWTGTGSSPIGKASAQTNGKVLGPQEVDTDIGRQSAVPVETNETYKAGDRQARSVSTVWFTPGVGIVRYRQETVSGDAGAVLLMKLKRHSLMR